MSNERYFDPAVAYAQIEAEMARAEKKAKRRTLWQAIKYACCTISAGIVQIVSFSILTLCIPENIGSFHFIIEQKTDEFIATTIGLALSIIWNFTINRKFTFKSVANVPRSMFLAFLFYVPFYPFQIWYVPTVSDAIGGGDLAEILATATVMLINGVLEFCWQKFFIYRNSQDSALEKYNVGEVGEFGEIAVEQPSITASDILILMRAGKDITADDKTLKRELKALNDPKRA